MPTKVVVASGIVTVLSAVGLTTVKVVSKLSADEHTVILESVKVLDEIINPKKKGTKTTEATSA